MTKCIRKIKVAKNGKNDISGTFQVQQRFMLQNPLPRIHKNPLDAYTYPEKIDNGKELLTTLKTVGNFSTKVAKKIMAENVHEYKETTVRPFNELIEGHYEGKNFVPATDFEKQVGEKALKRLMGDNSVKLTEEEQSQLFLTKNKIKIKNGFLDRAANYCKDVDQLEVLLDIIHPVCFASHMKFGQTDSVIERHKRLLAYFDEMLGKDRQKSFAA